jgi:NTP pyrophosphatase (non-canonical NTP hydrolase)
MEKVTGTEKLLDDKLRDLLKKDKEAWTLDEWVVGLYSIYRKHDIESTPSDIWLQVVNDASQLAEEVRRENYKPVSDEEGVLRQAVKMFCWISCFVGKYSLEGTQDLGGNDPIGSSLVTSHNLDDFIGGDEAYSKWIVHKFPGVCPVCGSNPCLCPSYAEIVENRKVDPRYEFFKGEWSKNIDAAKKRFNITDNTKNFRTKPLNQWIKFFSDIYGGVHLQMNLDQICFHLLEEVGEVSDELLYLTLLKKYQKQHLDNVFESVFYKSKGSIEGGSPKLDEQVNKVSTKKSGVDLGKALFEFVHTSNIENLKGELADVFSWLCAILHKLDCLIKPGIVKDRPDSFSFSRQIENHYKNFQGQFSCPACGQAKCDDLCLLKNLTTKILVKKNKKLSS